MKTQVMQVTELEAFSNDSCRVTLSSVEYKKGEFSRDYKTTLRWVVANDEQPRIGQLFDLTVAPHEVRSMDEYEPAPPVPMSSSDK